MLSEIQEPVTRTALLHADYSVHVVLLILKEMSNHYVRKMILNGARFVQVTVVRSKLRTLKTHLY